MKKIVLLTTFYFLIFNSFSSNIQNDLTISKTYYLDSCLYNNSIFFAKKALIKATKEKNYYLIATANKLIGLSYVEKNLYSDSAVHYLTKAKFYFNKINSKSNLAEIELGFLTNEILQGNSENLKKLYNLLHFFEKRKNITLIIRCISNIGRVYDIQGKFKQALKIETDKFQYCVDHKKVIEESYTYLKIANLHCYLKEFNKANVFNKNIFIKYPNLKTGYGKFRYLFCYSRYLKGIKKYDLSLKNMKKALKISIELNLKLEKLGMLTEIGSIYLIKNDIKNLILLTEIIKPEISKIHSNRFNFYLTNLLAKAYSLNKDYKNALKYSELSFKYQNLIVSKSSSLKIEELNSKYENSKKDEKINNLNKLSKIAKYRFYMMSFGIVLAAVLLTVITLFLILKNRSDKKTLQHQKEIVELESQKKIKALEIQILYAQMNPHFVFNCLSAIQSLFLNGDQKTANSKLNNFSRLLRLSIDHVKNDYVTLENELKFLKHYIDLEQLQFIEPFEFSLINNIEIELEEIMIPSMILQPYIENAINHGLKNYSGNRKLSMTLNEKDEKIEILIEDNGVGRIEAARIKANSSHQHESRGLGLVNEKILALKDLYNDSIEIYTIDLTDSRNNSLGTRIKLVFSKKIEWHEGFDS